MGKFLEEWIEENAKFEYNLGTKNKAVRIR